MDSKMKTIANFETADDAKGWRILNTPETRDHLRGLREIVFAKIQRFSARTAGWENGGVGELVESRAEILRASRLVPFGMSASGVIGSVQRNDSTCEAFWRQVVERLVFYEAK